MLEIRMDAPQTISIQEHLRIVREKDNAIHQLERKIRFREELDAVPSEIMSQTQKAALYKAIVTYQTEDKEPDGKALLKNTNELAKSAGMSTKTFQKSLSYIDSIGVIEKETKAIRDEETGGVKYIETRINPTELTFSPKLYKIEEDRNHGGKRMCCKCGSSRIKPTTTYTCMDCGEVHSKPPHYHPPIGPDDQLGIQVPPDEFEQETEETNSPEQEATIVEGSLVPDDQLGIQVPPDDLKDNLVLESNSKDILGQVGIQVPEEDSNNAPTSVSTPLDHTATIREWLERRQGTDLIIVSTGSLKSADKYLTITEEGYQPDLDAYITGKIGHIYGSRLRDPQNNRTQVLCFEIDDQAQDDQAQDNLVTLAKAGASPVYWQRYANGRRRGHLELYFDRPVSPERARHWAYSICPDLEEIPECYPCQDKANNALSWPLYQRIAGTVYPCTAQFMLPEPHDGGLQEVDPTNKEALARLITLAVTPAALVEEWAKRADQLATEQKRSKERGNEQGGVIGNKRQPITQVGDKDLAKQVIADFIRLHSWDWIANQCGGWNRDKFRAIWRGDKSATVRPDRDEVRACDYGLHSPFPKKFDQYDAWCMLQSGKGWEAFKQTDLADRCAQLRGSQVKQQKLVEVSNEE